MTKKTSPVRFTRSERRLYDRLAEWIVEVKNIHRQMCRYHGRLDRDTIIAARRLSNRLHCERGRLHLRASAVPGEGEF